MHLSEKMSLLLNMGSQNDWVSASLGREQYCSDLTTWDEERGFCPSVRLMTKDPL
jgi:hypothetical protein